MKGSHYESELLAKLLPHINPGDVVMDVGANYGVHTIPYAQKVGLEGEVYAFEPQGVIYNLLEENVRMNVADHQVHLYHQAVGHEVCEAALSGYCDAGKVIDYHRSQQTNYGGVSLGCDGEKVQMISIDSLNLARLDYIKIDVEGAEKLVIWGAKDTIERCRPIIHYEENRKCLTKEMIKMFNLPEEIVKFDIKKFLMEDMHYSKHIKMSSNMLVLP
jgi:FkbM family methyltransferase